MEDKPTWMQDPSNALRIHVDLDALRARLRTMNDADLLAFGRQMRSLVYPPTYDGKPSVSAFSIQLEEAGAKWRRRNRK